MKKVFVGIFGVLCSLPAIALTISGTVVDKNGEPLPGATVYSESTKRGLSADDNGAFRGDIGVDSNDKLTVSYVGCQDQIFAASQLKNKKIELDCIEQLNAAVVTASMGDYNVSGQYGCDDEDNEYIAPDLALCSTHAYNIGMTSNPENDSDREFMREVVALKTTLMTQQMNKQYEYLESMINRFKIQLEKAILLTRLEKAGASSESSYEGGSSSFASNDKYMVLSGTQNCMKMSSIDASLSCLQSNVRIAMDAINAGNLRDARKQLEQDVSAWKNIDDKAIADCSEIAKKTKKEDIQKCATSFNFALMNYMDTRNWERSQKKDK